MLNRGYCLEMDGQLGPALADYADACERGHDMACENQALLQGQGIKAERLVDQPPKSFLVGGPAGESVRHANACVRPRDHIAAIARKRPCRS